MPSAIISPCGTYRYLLTREVDPPDSCPCLFVMLNPSKADAEVNDPTIRKCIGFARKHGCTSLVVVNLFAYRATNPKELLSAVDPVGPQNDIFIRQQVEACSHGLIIAGWGSHIMTRHRTWVGDLLVEHGAKCLGINKDGSPGHPCYLSYERPLIPWRNCA